MNAASHEQGTVTGFTSSGYAKVIVSRTEACGSCEVKGACQALGGQTQDLELIMANNVAAEVGDIVQLTMAETAIVKASAILYLIPAVCLMLGAAAGYHIAENIGWSPDPVSAAGSLAGLLAGLIISWVISKQVAGKKAFMPRLTAVIYRPPSAT